MPKFIKTFKQIGGRNTQKYEPAPKFKGLSLTHLRLIRLKIMASAMAAIYLNQLTSIAIIFGMTCCERKKQKITF